MDINTIKLKFKNSFSVRKGITSFNDVVQINSLNERTRNKIYNSFYNFFDRITIFANNPEKELVKYIYCELFGLSYNYIPYNRFGNIDLTKVLNFLYQYILQKEYNEVFDLIEGVLDFYKDNKFLNFSEDINKIFEEENVNYRVINNMITDIIDENQIESINDTLDNNYVYKHFEEAIKLLYNVKDYKNSIKESICALEAECQLVSGEENCSLGKCLKILNLDIHPALTEGFSKLYGFSSDACGIRHANVSKELDVDMDLAKYFLISSSAFINYLERNRMKMEL